MGDPSSRKLKIKFEPNAKQRCFIESRAEADAFLSRMGEGKSAALCWAAWHYTVNNPGAVWIMIRDTWENMRATTLREFFHWFPPGVVGQWVAGEKKFVWAEGFAKGEVHFLGLDDPNDVGKLQSRTIAGFGVDEVAPAAGQGGLDELIFDVAMGRLRQPGMKWYAAKLAANNPDETHWLYRRFVDPGQGDAVVAPEDMAPEQVAGFRVWHPLDPENVRNLPPGYYERLRRIWGHRDDLVQRFVEGKYGFQQQGQAVTPQWSDSLHLTVGLQPVNRVPLTLLWDFGHNPTCVVTQVTPQGHWLVLDAMVGEGIGVAELIEQQVKPLLVDRYGRFVWKHVGDPAGAEREQTSIYRSAVRLLVRELGGGWRPGPVKWDDGVEPLRAVLGRSLVGGRGVVQVDRHRARAVWQALRGGWRFHVARTGVVSQEAVKDIHSHPGDAMRYGAGVLWPVEKLAGGRKRPPRRPAVASFGGRGAPASAPMQPSQRRPDGKSGPLGFERPGLRVPKEARRIGLGPSG